jgi:hypothetical protein
LVLQLREKRLFEVQNHRRKINNEKDFGEAVYDNVNSNRVARDKFKCRDDSSSFIFVAPVINNTQQAYLLSWRYLMKLEITNFCKEEIEAFTFHS